MSTATVAPAETQLLKVPDAMTVLSMGRTTIYQEINSGRLRSVKRGRSRRIPIDAITEYVKRLSEEN